MTPEEIITRLLQTLPRCCCCDHPATRQGRGLVIIGDQPLFCDTHSFAYRPRSPQEVSYEDLEIAEVVRAARELL